jgi:phosphoglycerate dehydrogenase-like enzyme
MKVLFRFDASDALKRRVNALSTSKIDITCCVESSDAEYQRLLPEAEVLWHVLKPVSAEQIAAAPKLKLIQKIGSGVNTIDLEAAKKRGIAVCNLPGANSRAVAEMALLLMLSCLRRLPELHSSVRSADWQAAWKLQDKFGELGGRTVGLIGYGAVPRLLEPMLVAMGAKVLYWSRSKKNAELAALVSSSDIVSLHLPLTPETKGILDPAKMKPGAILVNTARGGLVDEERLLESLKSGRLAAAGLDVFATEPAPKNHPLLALSNVICAPHLSWLTPETLERSLNAALENVRRLLTGEPLENRVA